MNAENNENVTVTISGGLNGSMTIIMRPDYVSLTAGNPDEGETFTARLSGDEHGPGLDVAKHVTSLLVNAMRVKEGVALAREYGAFNEDTGVLDTLHLSGTEATELMYRNAMAKRVFLAMDPIAQDYIKQVSQVDEIEDEDGNTDEDTDEHETADVQ